MPSGVEQLKELKFTITRKVICNQCNNAWMCDMNIHPTGSITLENSSVRTLLEHSLRATNSFLFENITVKHLSAGLELLSKTVKSCPERVKIVCELPGRFICTICSPQGYRRCNQTTTMSVGNSSYTLTLNSPEPGSSNHTRTTGSVRVVISQPSSSGSSRPLPPLPLSLPRPTPARRVSFTDNIFSQQTTRNQICSVLANKEKGCYAIVKLQIQDGGPEYLKTPYLILCLQLREEFKIVYEEHDKTLFIHKEARFASLKCLLDFYKTHPTKCGAILKRQLTKAELSTP